MRTPVGKTAAQVLSRRYRPAARLELRVHKAHACLLNNMTLQRKKDIMIAASDHFGRFGYRGTSLRDIAHDAGVSLTLIDHHFGSKSSLLLAVVEAQRPFLNERVRMLDEVTRGGEGSFSPADLVRGWVRVAFEAVSREHGLTYVHLLARVIDEPLDESARVDSDKLDKASRLFIDAICRCCPGASRRTAASAYVWINASLLGHLLGSRRIFKLIDAEDNEGSDTADQARLTRFLVAGVQSLLAE